MLNGIFNNVTDKEKDDSIENIIQHASPRQDFFLMMVLSVSMATFGVVLNSIVILIGSMLIAPLLYSLLSLSLGIIAADKKLIGRSIFTFTKSVVLALGASVIIGFLFASRITEITFLSDIFSGSSSALMYAIVAAIAGFAAAFATTKPHLNNMLPGVAISVALVPPLAITGVGIALWDWTVITNSITLLLVNVIGILFSAMIVFSLMNFSVKRSITREAVKEDEEIIKQESSAQ